MGRSKQTHCKRGHERTLENVANSGGCKICIKDSRQTPEYKERRRAYSQTSKGRANQKKRREKYRQTTECKEYNKAYQRAYTQTPEYKANMRELTARATDMLHDNYIKNALHLPASNITPELIELKRTQIKLRRFVKAVKYEMVNHGTA